MSTKDLNLEAYFHGDHQTPRDFETIGRFKIVIPKHKTPGNYDLVRTLKEDTELDIKTVIEIAKKLKQDRKYIFEHDLELMEKFRNHDLFYLKIEHVPIPYADRTDEQLQADNWNEKARNILDQREFSRIAPEFQNIEKEIQNLDKARGELLQQLPEKRQQKYQHYSQPVG